MNTAVIHTRIDPQTKRGAEHVLHGLGITPAEAIRIFFRQVALRGGLPFAVELPKAALPNAQTAATLEKSRRGEEVETFDSPETLFASWEA